MWPLPYIQSPIYVGVKLLEVLQKTKAPDIQAQTVQLPKKVLFIFHNRQTDSGTYRLNWPGGPLGENCCILQGLFVPITLESFIS